MRRCSICERPIKLVPSAAERAKKYGGEPRDYTNAFTTHATCFLQKRGEEARALMRRLWERENGTSEGKKLHDRLVGKD